MSIRDISLEQDHLAQLAADVRVGIAAMEADYRSMVGHALNVGDALLEAKAAAGHGYWSDWLAGVGVNERTARDYMRLARNRQRVADLPSVRRAIAVLAAPNEPEPEPMAMTTQQLLDLMALIARYDALHDQYGEEPVTSREEAERRSDLTEKRMKLTGILLHELHDQGVHTALGLTWAEWIDRVFPPSECPAWLYVMLRDAMLTVGGAA